MRPPGRLLTAGVNWLCVVGRVYPVAASLVAFDATERHSRLALSLLSARSMPMAPYYIGSRLGVVLYTMRRRPCRFAPCRLDAGDNTGPVSVSSYRMHASETHVPTADATSVMWSGVDMGQPSTTDGPTCNTPRQHSR